MPEPVSPWHHWARLPRAEKRIALALAWRLPWVHVWLRVAGVKRTRRHLLRGLAAPRPGPCLADERAAAQRLASLAATVGGRGGSYTSCLRQALVVEQWLRRRGLPAQLRIGVRKSAAKAFDAHAWVELDGVALAQPTLNHVTLQGADERLR